jgi:hypothetical protein
MAYAPNLSRHVIEIDRGMKLPFRSPIFECQLFATLVDLLLAARTQLTYLAALRLPCDRSYFRAGESNQEGGQACKASRCVTCATPQLNTRLCRLSSLSARLCP